MTFRLRCTWRPPYLVALSALAFLLPGCAGTSAATPGAHPTHPAASPSSSAALVAVSPFASPGLRGYLASRAGQVTAALYDARTNQTWLLGPGFVQDTASIVKVQIMGTALRQAETAGRQLSASDAALMTTMIENSDNRAATKLLSRVGGPRAIARFDHSAGLEHTVPSTLAFIPGTSLPGWGLTTTTALDEVTLVSRFAYPNSILSARSRQYGLNLMQHVQSDQGWGVGSGAPGGTTVALKNGWLPLPPSNRWQVNSIGWVSGHGHDYVLAVLTNGNPTEAYGVATIEAIARAVYAQLGTAG